MSDYGTSVQPCGRAHLSCDDCTKVRLDRILKQARANDCREAKLARLVEALAGLIDNEPCRLDHHGNCQTHRLNNPCEMAVARAVLDEWSKP